MANSKVPWTEKTINFYTWNCTTKSPGCVNCYARRRSQQYPQNSAGYQFDAPPEWRENAVEELRALRSGYTVFVNDHSDSYHEKASLVWIRRIHSLIRQRPGLIFQVLTKRPERALELASQLDWPPNLWLGVSVESPAFLHRVKTLLQIPAKHRFVSFEPLLKPISLVQLETDGAEHLDWMIVGGESGQAHRPFNKAWLKPFLEIREEYNVPLFFKQSSHVLPDQDYVYEGKEYREFPLAFYQIKREYQPEQPKQGNLF